MQETPQANLPIRIIIVVAIFIAFIGLAVGGSYWMNAGKVIPGVRVLGEDFGNLKRREALEKLQKMKSDAERRTITLQLGVHKGQFTVAGLGISLDTEATLDKIMAFGHRGKWLKRWRERTLIAQAGREVAPVLTVRQAVLKKLVREFAGANMVEPKDAYFDTTGDAVKIVPGKEGTDIDWISFSFALERFLAPEGEGVVSLTIINLEPQVKAADLAKMKINGLLSSNTTHFDSSKTNRVYNIRTAAAALDGEIIAPQKEISFNAVVGPRSIEAGYQKAPVIENNELVEGVGGGVCQVSTTFYGAALKADMAVLERSNHSLAVTYVPLGQDATVVDDSIDLKLKNPYNDYLLIKSEVGRDKITFKIFGNRINKADISLVQEIIKNWGPKTVYEKDSSLPSGVEKVKRAGSQGYTVRTYRIVKKGGVVIRRDTLPQSFYVAQDRVIIVGTRALSVSSPPKKENKPPDKKDKQNVTPPGGSLPANSGGTGGSDSPGGNDGGNAGTGDSGANDGGRDTGDDGSTGGNEDNEDTGGNEGTGDGGGNESNGVN